MSLYNPMWQQLPQSSPTMNAPAFTTVNTKRTLSRPYIRTSTPSEIPQTPQPVAKRKIDWPQSVRDYVQRSFAPEAAVAGVSKEAVETMLKKVINEAAEKNALFDVKWETFPLPQELIQRERLDVPLGIQSSSAVPDESPAKIKGLASQTNGLSISRKRKSSEMASSDAELSSVPPWERANRIDFESRITYSSPLQAKNVDKRQKKILEGNSINGISKYQDQADMERRKQRFNNAKSGNSSPFTRTSSRDGSPTENIKGPVIGTCQNLEKNFFRLTSEPKPESVRPLPILEKTLELLKRKWRQENNYTYICDQFKSLRQDLTVQHIKTEFTVTVYEIHARIALEKGDLGEYNQCQTQLRALYSQKLGGHPSEFLAYRILYFIHTCNRTDMNDLLADLTVTDKNQTAVKHALAVRSALAAGNYHKFFRLYLDTPNMGAYLMDMFVVRERLAALANICKAYKPDVGIRFLTEELGFESDHDCAQFLCDQGAQQFLEEKDGGIHLLTGKVGPIFESAKTTAFRKVDIKGQI